MYSLKDISRAEFNSEAVTRREYDTVMNFVRDGILPKDLVGKEELCQLRRQIGFKIKSDGIKYTVTNIKKYKFKCFEPNYGNVRAMQVFTAAGKHVADIHLKYTDYDSHFGICIIKSDRLKQLSILDFYVKIKKPDV